MKLIALKDFARVAALEDLEIPDRINDRHIHRGAVFAIGKADTLKELSAADKMLVAQLFVSGCVGDATDAKVIKRVQDDAAADKSREANRAKLDSTAQMSHLGETILARLKGK